MASAPTIQFQGKVLKALMMSMDTAIVLLLITDLERARTCRIALTVSDEGILPAQVPDDALSNDAFQLTRVIQQIYGTVGRGRLRRPPLFVEEDQVGPLPS